MEDNENKIRQFRRQIEEDIYIIRREKNKELYEYCISLGGHYFWDWKKILIESVNPEFNHFVEQRMCTCCHFRESREIEGEKETAFSLANKMAKNDCKTLVNILKEEE
jgi:hypothetical protein